ncbi:hypothetical protein C0Z17_21060 [Trinickia caryophylli]|nr:hypothetical protein C0Z17_21060 [Trinickia caryophylli]
MLCAAAVSLVHAQPHPAQVSFRPPGSGLTLNALTRPPVAPPGAKVYQTANAAYADRRGARSGPRTDRRKQGRLAAPSAGGIPYRSIAQDARNAPRPPGNSAYMRSGSIRDAVTRYNEERVTGRPPPRPAGPNSRLPDPSLYRN